MREAGALSLDSQLFVWNDLVTHIPIKRPTCRHVKTAETTMTRRLKSLWPARSTFSIASNAPFMPWHRLAVIANVASLGMGSKKTEPSFAAIIAQRRQV